MGKRVALIGLDGSGKSANIEKMKRDSDYSDYNFYGFVETNALKSRFIC